MIVFHFESDLILWLPSRLAPSSHNSFSRELQASISSTTTTIRWTRRVIRWAREILTVHAFISFGFSEPVAGVGAAVGGINADLC